MADLLGEVDVNVAPRLPVKSVKSESRRKTRVLSSPVTYETKAKSSEEVQDVSNKHLLNTPPSEPHYDPSSFDDDVDDRALPVQDPTPSSPAARAAGRKVKVAIKAEDDGEEDDMMEIAQATGDSNRHAASINVSGARPKPKVVKAPAYPSPASSSPTRPPAVEVDATAWTDVTSKLNVISSQESNTVGKVNIEDALESDGRLRMFWTDYTEVNGSLCLFGKVKDRNSDTYVSAFVKVDNILRKVYFLPRSYRQSTLKLRIMGSSSLTSTEHGKETSFEVEMGDVYQEADETMSRLKVGMHKIKPCSRKYAFELPDIPKEADYLKAMYPYDSKYDRQTFQISADRITEPALPAGLTGETFSHVFGSSTALFEQFVLWKHIMGPCWLDIADSECSQLNNASWCKFEAQVANPKAISILSESDNLDAPPLNFMSLSFRTTLNVKENKQEILVASARIYENVSLTETTPPEKLPCKTYTIMRPTEGSFPVGFESLSKKQRGTIILEKSENMLLAKFLALFERADPDVLVGHQLQEVDYPVLLSRFREKKTPGWHRIGRLRRSEWPKNFGKGNNSFFTERQIIAGRLLCDVANDMGKVLFSAPAELDFADCI